MFRFLEVYHFPEGIKAFIVQRVYKTKSNQILGTSPRWENDALATPYSFEHKPTKVQSPLGMKKLNDEID